MKIDQDTVAVITGAASGIGRATAIRLAQSGANLALSDVNVTGLAATADEARAFGVKVTTHVVDVADKEGMQNFAADVEREHGRVSILLNNAGVAIYGKADELSLDDYEWLIGINFWGVVYGTKLFMPLLKKQPEAYVLNISSIFGIIAPIGQSAYSAAKFGVRGFTESLRHELMDTNIRVAVIHPGGVKTNIAARAKVGTFAIAEEHKDAPAQFETVARTTPEQAAERIVRGILRNEQRIMIGADSRFLALLQKFFPVRYWRIIKPFYDKNFPLKPTD